ncbi:MAG: hypothetical protein HC804_04040 [Anaerolineae bacterium]|nr:hypothetical protein [Anaerolineae bacterium]
MMQWLAQQPNVKTLYIQYSDVLADPQPSVTQINTFLGGHLNSQAMTASVDPTLYRNRQETAVA